MMNEIIAFFILLMGGCVGVIDAAEGAASITGRVVITKVMTKKRVILPSYDMRGMTVNSSSPAASSAVGSVTDELSRVVLYLEGPGLRNPAPLQGTLIQKNRHFDPDLLVIPVGSTVSFPNDDPIFHNVFSLSKVKQFDLGYYPAGETRTVKFEKPGIVQVYCHIHPDMSAAIIVLATSFWTRPGSDGKFAFSEVPPGAYDLVAWHRSAGFFRRHITLPAKGTLDEDFVIPVKDLDSSVTTQPGSSK
jgi:hypothetical protein